MRAVTCVEFGPPERLIIREVPLLQPGHSEIVVAASACGVQFVDNRLIGGSSLLNTSKLDAHHGRSVQLKLPFVPGMEAAGIVKAIGEKVTSVKPGDRVLGTCYFGAFAEEVLFDESEVCRIPDDMDFNTAACFFVASFTAHYSLITRADLHAGETVLVLAAGSGVGLAAIEISKAKGARVIAAASSDKKLALAQERGADALIRYPFSPMDGTAQRAFLAEIRQACEGAGPNVVIDMVGGTYAEPSMRSMAFKGRYISVGFSAGIPAIPMHVILNKNGALIGIEPASGEENRIPGRCKGLMDQLFSWHADGKLRPLITQTYPLECAAEALRSLLARKAAGRVILTTGS